MLVADSLGRLIFAIELARGDTLANSWHSGGKTVMPIGSGYDADLHKHWWARTVPNRRPLVCKTIGVVYTVSSTARGSNRTTVVRVFLRIPGSTGSGWRRVRRNRKRARCAHVDRKPHEKPC